MSGAIFEGRDKGEDDEKEKPFESESMGQRSQRERSSGASRGGIGAQVVGERRMGVGPIESCWLIVYG